MKVDLVFVAQSQHGQHRRHTCGPFHVPDGEAANRIRAVGGVGEHGALRLAHRALSVFDIPQSAAVEKSIERGRFTCRFGEATVPIDFDREIYREGRHLSRGVASGALGGGACGRMRWD